MTGECHAEAYACCSPCLGESSQRYEVGILVEVVAQRTLGREVAICLIDDDDALEGTEDMLYLLTLEGVARRVVGRTDEDDLCVVVACGKETVGVKVEGVSEGHFAVLHIVDVGAHLIHAVCRVYGYNIVDAGTAEDAEWEVNGLIATVAEEDVVDCNSLEGSYELL